MNRIQSIMVGIDFSECSRMALLQAARLAKDLGAHLHVIHVVEYLTLDDEAWNSHVSQERLIQDAMHEARSLIEEWISPHDLGDRLHIHVESGIPLDIILSQVRKNHIDLLVAGVNGSSMLPWGAGTLATKFLRKANTKVMLVHERQTRPFTRLVVGIDFSQQSKEAIIQARRLAAMEGSQIHYLHVFTGKWGPRATVPQVWIQTPELAEQYRQALETRLREFVGSEDSNPVEFRIVESDSHGHGLAEYARHIQADLAVVGTKGKSNLKYVLLGSTVERLMREVPCSALVIRPPVDADTIPE